MILLVMPLQVIKINVCYWKETVPGSYDLNHNFPCFLLTESEESKEHIYGLPSNEYPGMMKVLESVRRSSVIIRKENHFSIHASNNDGNHTK